LSLRTHARSRRVTHYFDPRVTSFEAPEDVIDDGTVDTVLFQYIRRFAPLFGASSEGPHVALALYGMYNPSAPSRLNRIASSSEPRSWHLPSRKSPWADASIAYCRMGRTPRRPTRRYRRASSSTPSS